MTEKETKILPLTSNTMFKEVFGKKEGKEVFKKAKKHIQINLNNYNKPKGRVVGISRLMDIETKEEKTDQIEIHDVNLELINRNCYNKEVGELTGIEKLSKFLLSKTREEMENIMDKELESVLDKISELSKDERVIGWYNKEEEEEMIRGSIEADALERGEAKGIKKAKKEMVINMLKKNIDIDTIFEISGLTTNQILELK